MKSFGITGNFPHDLDIQSGVIRMSEGNDLFREKLQAVWSTNKGEWNLDSGEGINFHAVLKKNPDHDEIRAELEEALQKVSPTAELTDFLLTEDTKQRHLLITVNVQDNGNTYTVPLEYD